MTEKAEKKPRLISEQGGTVSEYAVVREEGAAQPKSAPVTQVEEAEAEPPAVPTIKMFDWTHRQVSRQQKQQWRFISDDLHGGSIYHVGYGVFVVCK